MLQARRIVSCRESVGATRVAGGEVSHLALGETIGPLDRDRDRDRDVNGDGIAYE
jgi:hypothetical protein